MEKEPMQNLVDDPNKALVGANAEKTLRDISSGNSGIDVSEEESRVLNEVAEKQGEKAMNEYESEKSKNPVEKLFTFLDEMSIEMKKSNLEQDSVIVDKIKDRIDSYVAYFKKIKEDFEQHNNQRFTVDDFLKNYNYTQYGQMMKKGIPVTHQIAEDGGWLYKANGWHDSFINSTDGVDLEEWKKKQSQDGYELINYSFSKQGESEFCRKIGALKDNEEMIDVPQIYQKIIKRQVDPKKYEAKLPTNIDGLILNIKEDFKRSWDGLKEKSVSLEFDDNFMRKLLAD